MEKSEHNNSNQNRNKNELHHSPFALEQKYIWKWWMSVDKMGYLKRLLKLI